MGLEVGDVVPQVERVRPTKHLVVPANDREQRKRKKKEKEKENVSV